MTFSRSVLAVAALLAANMQSSWRRRRAARVQLIGSGLAAALMLMAGMAAPSMAEEGFSEDLGVIRACASDVWSLCSDVLPDVGRIKSCVQNKMGQLSKGCLDKLLDAMAGSSFKVCKDQTYALCAAARCNVFDGVAYCQCDVKHGDSISLPFPMGKDEDVCSINARGAANKYMISTYSLPESIASPQGGGAVYTCQGEEGGAYAQCDGGLCFRSTEETTFPGFDKPVPKGQIICSCPITKSSGANAQSYQILGPYPCDKSFFKYCKAATANSKTGSTIYVGAPAGTAAALAVQLNGKVPPLNECGADR